MLHNFGLAHGNKHADSEELLAAHMSQLDEHCTAASARWGCTYGWYVLARIALASNDEGPLCQVGMPLIEAL